MNYKCKRYRDVMVAPGSQLFEALETGDAKKAEAIYTACMRVERQLIAKGQLHEAPPQIFVDD